MEHSPAAARFVRLLDKMSVVIFIFVLLLVIYVITRYVRCVNRGIIISHRRLRNRFGEENPVNIVDIPSGLDREIMEALPIFVYKSHKVKKGLECAVCLSEFQENEKGRLLPICEHSFHIHCIDRWFHSHSTCPVCRAKIQAYSSGKRAEAAINESLAGTEQAVSSANNNGGFVQGHETKGQTSCDEGTIP